MMNVFVLGSKGMLGRYIYKHLSKNYNIIEINRNQLNAEQFTREDIACFFDKNNLKKDDVVINCIGMIKPQVDKLGPIAAIKVNSLFPRNLSDYVECK